MEKKKTTFKGNRPWLTPKGTKPPQLKKTKFIQHMSLAEWKATHPNAS